MGSPPNLSAPTEDPQGSPPVLDDGLDGPPPSEPTYAELRAKARLSFADALSSPIDALPSPHSSDPLLRRESIGGEPMGSHLSPITPNFHTYWDSVMLGNLKTCPAKFYYQHILGYQPKGLSIHLYFGQLLHASLERYYHSRAEGDTHDAACLRMVRWALENSGEYRTDGLTSEPSSPPSWHPWTPDPSDINASIKNRATLVRSLIWYVEDHCASPFTTVILANGKPAVELSFRFHAFDIENEPITLCGHLDRLVELHDGRVWVADHKSSKSALTAQYFRQFTPNNQFSLYTIAGKVVLDKPCEGVLVSGIQVGVTFTRSAIHQAPRPEPVLTEWLADTRHWITLARQYALANHWPMNDLACGNYGGCPFQSVCAVSPSHRLAWLKADFQSWSWNPLEIRGDV